MKTTEDTRSKTQDSPSAYEMHNRSRFTHFRGLTLPEITVVIAIVALLVGLTLPVVNMLLNSFESESGAKSMINAALASARAIAAKEQRYAGIRFQKLYDPNIPDPINAPQYMIFIIHDLGRTEYASGFRAVDGIKPIKLPDSIGVVDLRYHDSFPPGDGVVNTEPEIADPDIFRDTTTFSIVFSPSGKLVIHDVRAWNRDGKVTNSGDDIFNTANNVINGIAMFYQDGYPALGFEHEPSRNCFYIYETKKFKQAYNNGDAWNYLSPLSQKPVYINPYTGTIIGE